MATTPGHRPASAGRHPSARGHPELFQASQRVLPESSLNRRYYHLGVLRTVPPPDDRDPDEYPEDEPHEGMSQQQTTSSPQHRQSTTMRKPLRSPSSSSATPSHALQHRSSKSRPGSGGSTASLSISLASKGGSSAKLSRPTSSSSVLSNPSSTAALRKRLSSTRGSSAGGQRKASSAATSVLKDPDPVDATAQGDGADEVTAATPTSSSAAEATASRPPSALNNTNRTSKPVDVNDPSSYAYVSANGTILSGTPKEDRPGSKIPIAYRPYSTMPMKNAVNTSGGSGLSGSSVLTNRISLQYSSASSQQQASGFPPPPPTVVLPVEKNQHFVTPEGDRCSGGGTDFTAHFINRPSYNFEEGKHMKHGRPSSASMVTADMKKALWKAQRDAAADWVPAHRAISEVSNNTSTEIQRAMAREGQQLSWQMQQQHVTSPSSLLSTASPGRIRPSTAMSRSSKNRTPGDHHQPRPGSASPQLYVGGSSSPSLSDWTSAAILSPEPSSTGFRQRSSSEVARCSSASHATRMMRVQRRVSQATAPLSAMEVQQQVHPNQVVVHL